MKGTSMKISREQLYNEIWEISVAGVAKKYNAPYDQLLKLCKKHNIPIPPSGYWVKLSFGKPVTKTPLPESANTEITLPDDTASKRERHIAVVIENNVAEEIDISEKKKVDEESDISEDSTLTYRTESGERNTYNREKLYQEVWAKPAIKVAAQYGVSNVAIRKICNSLNVPLPPIGYWAKLRAGQKLPKTPLPAAKGVTERTGTKTFDGIKIPDAPKQMLEFLAEVEREKVILAAEQIKMPDENAHLHKKITAYKSVVKEWNKKDTKPEGAEKGLKNYYNRPPFLAGVISNETLPRVYRILDALFRQVESLGGSIDDDLSLRIRNEHVELEIVEAQNEIKHVLTRKEAQEMLIYEDAQRHNTWASKPQIRKYDYVFNGRLRITIRKGRYFRDTEAANIESKLGDMLIELYEESEVVRLEREAREEAARKKEEEARQREERRNRYNKEVERITALENAAMDYETACRIRAYIQAVEIACYEKGMDNETAAWIEWAKKKADWYDPIVARDDELLGERQHENNTEQKVLKKSWSSWW